MTHPLNTRARLARAVRNKVPLQSATETFKKFKWFTLVVAILLPIYPSLSLIGTDATAHGADYDETSIITAYTDDSLGGGYFSENGMIAVGEKPTPVATSQKEELSESGDVLTTQTGADARRSPQILRYTIQNGDTLAKLADRYDVSIDAIRWANDSNLDMLKPGNTIKIPPTSGVVHIVQAGDTLSEIAAKYSIDGDSIARFNQLDGDNRIRIGMELMIPGAQKQAVKAIVQNTPNPAPNPAKPKTKQTLTPIPQDKPSTKPVVLDSKTGLKSSYRIAYSGNGRGFVGGNCTWYVAQNKNVTWRGNANAWIRNARAQGVATGSRPVPGAIIQFSGRGYSRAYGHVGIVADVTDDYVIVKDMNYRGLYEVTIRKVSKSDPAIDGYIYVD